MRKFFLLPVIVFCCVLAMGCATNAKIRTPMISIGEEGNILGQEVARDDEGYPLHDVDGKPLFEAKDGFMWRMWQSGHNDDFSAETWSDNMADVSATFAVAATSLIEPWVAPALMIANALGNGQMLSAITDIAIPTYGTGVWIEIAIPGEVVAAGGKSLGNEINTPEAVDNEIGIDHEIKGYSWWVLFDKDVSDETMKAIQVLLGEEPTQ